MAFSGRAGWWYDGFTFRCAPVALDCAAGAYTVGTATALETYGGTGGTELAEISCDPGTVAVGASIGTGYGEATGYGEGTGYITAFGLACEAPAAE